MTWPRDMRLHLAESRRAGLSFDDAWNDAMAVHPALPHAGHGWTVDLANWARDLFRKAYHRLPVGTGSIDDPAGHDMHRTPLVADHGGCRSGAGCSHARVDGSRFCEWHGAELARIRSMLEAEEAHAA